MFDLFRSNRRRKLQVLGSRADVCESRMLLTATPAYYAGDWNVTTNAGPAFASFNQAEAHITIYFKKGNILVDYADGDVHGNKVNPFYKGTDPNNHVQQVKFHLVQTDMDHFHGRVKGITSMGEKFKFTLDAQRKEN
ncbi:MAG: hypothetical protein U0903_18605 [Planctomycetales bacterium]